MQSKLSIIVVAYNIENFIEQCLRSCLSAVATNYEVIVVHNASTDRTLEAIQRVKSEHPDIFTVIENVRNEGLGEGRNIGMASASGEYVMFLDGDDWLKDGAVNRVIKVLGRRQPDVLMYSFNRIWDTGGKAANPHQHLHAERDISNPKKRAAIIPSMGVAWNRAYKKEFLLRNNFRFNRRYYEDIDWNFAVILKAETYYVIPDRLVFYRQRPGSITKKVDPRHMDMLDQYRDVCAMHSANPEKARPYAKATYIYARGQLLYVVASDIRLPKNLNRPFLRGAASLMKEWRAVVGFRKKRDSQILAASTGSAWIANSMIRFTKWSRDYKLPNYRESASLWLYRNVFVRLPIQENKAVFESYWGKKIDCNPEAIAAGLAKTGKHTIVWGLEKPGEHDWPHKHIACDRGSLAYLYHLATAKYLVSNVNFAGTVIKRLGSKHVQTFHGTPIKAMGVDIRPIRPKENNWRSFATKCRKWDVGISSNAYSTSIWRRSHPYNYHILETGYPRNDALANSAIDCDSVRAKLGVPKDKRIVLYAPTFRDDYKGKPIPVAKDIIDFERIQSALGPEYVLMVRAHHLSKIPILPKDCIDASGHRSINDVLAVADVLITDYSSLLFDYATQKRPIVIYAYDYDDYTKKRGVYFDIRENAPGAVASGLENLLACLRDKSFESAENRAKLEEFHAKFCRWDDGRATDRVLSEVFGIDLNETHAALPLENKQR